MDLPLPRRASRRHRLPAPPAGGPGEVADRYGVLAAGGKTHRMGIRPRRAGESRRPGRCGALSPPGGGPNRWRDPFRPLSRGGRTLPGGASRRVGARGTFLHRLLDLAAEIDHISVGIPVRSPDPHPVAVRRAGERLAETALQVPGEPDGVHRDDRKTTPGRGHRRRAARCGATGVVRAPGRDSLPARGRRARSRRRPRPGPRAPRTGAPSSRRLRVPGVVAGRVPGSRRAFGSTRRGSSGAWFDVRGRSARSSRRGRRRSGGRRTRGRGGPGYRRRRSGPPDTAVRARGPVGARPARTGCRAGACSASGAGPIREPPGRSLPAGASSAGG